MDNFVFIMPGRSNPEGKEQGHWRVMLTENGSTRHLQDVDERSLAIVKAERTAAKRGYPFDLEYEHKPRSKSKSGRRGYPPIGSTVRYSVFDHVHEFEVKGYLSEQFYGERHIVHITENWEVI